MIKYINKKLLFQIPIAYLPRIVPIFTGPLILIFLTKSLTKSNYGIYSLLISWSYVAISVASLGLPKYLIVYLPGFDLKKQYSAFKTITLCQIFFYLILLLIVFILNKNIANILNINNKMLLPYILIAYLFFLLTQSAIRFFNLQKRISFAALIGAMEKITLLLSFGLFFYFFKINIYSAIFCHGIAYLTTCVVASLGFNWYSLIKNKIDFSYFYKGLKFGLPLIIIDMFWWTIQAIDKTLLSKIAHDSAALGDFSYASKYLWFVWMAATPVAWAIYPYIAKKFWVYKKTNKESDKKHFLFLFVMEIILITSIAGVSSFILITFADFLIPLLSRIEYLSASYLFLYIMPIPVLLLLISILQQIILLNEKNIIITISYIFAIVIHIILSFILIPNYNALGPIFAGYISLGLLLFIHIILCLKIIFLTE